MTFPILGGNGAGEEQYLIDNSLRFNNDDSAKLERTFSAGNQTDWTFSAWVKRGNFGGNQIIFGRQNVGDGANVGKIFFESNNKIKINNKVGGSTGFEATTNAVFRDVSAWYHIFISFDGNQSTHNDRAELYVNGVLQSWSGSGSLSAGNGHINLALAHAVGFRAGDGGEYFDGYIAEMYFIDGNSSLSHTDFGEFDEDSGIWKPIEYTGSFSGTNSFYLDFEDSGSLGADQSGNGNNFTPTNLASTDQTTDTPTNNFCTMNPLEYTGATYGTGTLSEGNCKVTIGDNNTNVASFTLNQGKWYWEQKHISSASSQNRIEFGILQQDVPDYIGGDSLPNTSGKGLVWGGFGDLRGYISTSSFGTFAPNDIIGCALDMDAQTLQFYKNGSAVSTAQDFSGAGWTNVAPTVFCSNNAGNEVGEINFGNPSFSISSGNSDDNGYGNFEYAPPSGYLALCTQNLATELSPTIDDGSEYFNTVLWSGNSVDDRSITGVGFAPDLVSIKNRGLSTNFYWYDTTRGADNQIISNATNAEQTITNKLQAFESDGFQLGTSSEVNASSYSYVGWSWKANAGSTSSNTDGSITSTVQANTTAGFSIVTYTGTGSNATVGHGLNQAPEIIIVKNRDYSPSDWQTGSDYLTSWAYRLKLNGTNAEASVTSSFNSTAPTSTVINIGNNDDVNRSGDSHIIYAFHSVEGYSKFGSYTGNGSTDGVMVTTMFRPAWVMIKRTDSADNWIIFDNKRDSFNGVGKMISANLSNAEFDDPTDNLDFVSNGFKLTTSNARDNASGGTYIYMAFAESPFVSSTSIPVTAR